MSESRETFLRNHDENVRIMRMAQRSAEDAGSDDSHMLSEIADKWQMIGELVKSGEPPGLAFAQEACTYSAQILDKQTKRIGRLEAINADLLAACESLIDEYETGLERDDSAAIRSARAVINNVKGGPV